MKASLSHRGLLQKQNNIVCSLGLVTSVYVAGVSIPCGIRNNSKTNRHTSKKHWKVEARTNQRKETWCGIWGGYSNGIDLMFNPFQKFNLLVERSQHLLEGLTKCSAGKKMSRRFMSNTFSQSSKYLIRRKNYTPKFLWRLQKSVGHKVACRFLTCAALW